MPMAEVRRYFDYIRAQLADDGLFYFFNHHRVVEGAQKPSDYPFNQFAVQAWRPMPHPQQYFFGARQAYEVLMQRQHGERLPSYFDVVTHTLSQLMFMGVNSNLTDVCTRLIEGKISEEELTYLAALHKVITAPSVNTAQSWLASHDSPATWLPVTLYVSGLLRFFAKDMTNAAHDMQHALESGLTGFAKTRALIFLALTANTDAEQRMYLNQASENTPQFKDFLETETLTLDQLKRAYQYVFPQFHLDRTLIPRRLRRMLTRLMK
jgi:hypothetical protein